MPKAVRLHEHGGPEVLRVEDLDPGAPVEGELQVRHSAIGVNYIDVYDRTGLYPMSLPGVLGREAAGVVVGLGRRTSGFRIGERVAYVHSKPGAYADVRNIPA
jgi:NADPH:quinone reductase